MMVNKRSKGIRLAAMQERREQSLVVIQKGSEPETIWETRAMRGIWERRLRRGLK